MENLTIESRLKKLKDPQRNFMWEIEIIDPINPFFDALTNDVLKFRVKQLSTPSREIETIDTWFYGFKQSFPGRTTFNGQVTMLLEETEDQVILNSIYDWMESITGVDPTKLQATLGKSRFYAKTMFIKLLRYSGKPSKTFIELKNIYPLSLREVDLDYQGNDSVKYSVTFNFDYWKLVKPGV